MLGHAGARGTAFSNVTMLDELFDLDEIRVTSRRPESREAFGEQLRAATDTPVRVVDTRRGGLRRTPTSSSRRPGSPSPTPLLRTAAVKPGAFVVPYGTVSAVELDLLDVMDKVVVDDWREAQSGRFGALRAHVDTGRLSPETLYAELGQVVVRAASPAASTTTSGSCCWHRGLSILDVAVAHLILQRAEAADVGTMLRYR